MTLCFLSDVTRSSCKVTTHQERDPTTMKFLFPLFFLIATATATEKRDETQQLTIYNDTKSGYIYHGCFNETLGLEGTNGVTRALYDGVNEVLEGAMTVGRCL